MLCLSIIIENEIYSQEGFAAFIWGVKNVQGEGVWGMGLLKFSRLINCEPGLFILTVECVQNMPHESHLFWLARKSPMYGWF